MSNVKIVNDNSEEILRRFADAKKRGLIAVGMTAEKHAKDELSRPKPHANGEFRPNVDTGRLRNSVTFALSGEPANISSYSDDKGNAGTPYAGNAPTGKHMGVFIGSNVEYAPLIENGGRTSRAYPFLRPAASGHAEEYKHLIKESMENG